MKDLMIPRYEVIADWPNRPLTMPIGHILYLNKFGAGKYWHEYTDEEPLHIDEGSTRYPVVLRKLEWWEKRTVDEMPKYLKYFDGNGALEFVLKVEKYKLHTGSNTFWAFEYLWENEPDIKRMSLTGWLPATETEYNDYIASL